MILSTGVRSCSFMHTSFLNSVFSSRLCFTVRSSFIKGVRITTCNSQNLLKARNVQLNVFGHRWRSWLSKNQSRITFQHHSLEKTDCDGLHNVYIPSSTSITRDRIRRTRQRIRETKLEMSKRMEGMKENIWTIPNGLCVLRIALTPVLSYLVVSDSYLLAMGIFAVAGVTDFLDGYIARKFPNQRSVCGTFLDPIADKFLVATLFLSLTYVGLLPVPLTALIIARDGILVGAGFYIRYLSLLPPRTVTKYFDVTLATASVSPSVISKFNTGMQMTLIAATLTAPILHFVDHPCLHALWYATACSTVASGLGYLFTKNNYTILSKRR